MSANELSKKVHDLKELKAMAEELNAEITAIEDAIKAEMTTRRAEVLTVDIFTIRWTPVSSSRIDTAAFKKAMPDLAAQFTKITQSRRFTVA